MLFKQLWKMGSLSMVLLKVSTLEDHVKGQVKHGFYPDSQTALSKEEEDALCLYLDYVAEQGFPLKPKIGDGICMDHSHSIW